VQSKVEEKPNIASLPKLRYSSDQQGQRGAYQNAFGITHSQDLLEVERAHIATVAFGARPFWVEHCEAAN
jgi:hypothetical protein